MKLEYRQALFEVYKILENTDENIKNRIPKRFIEFIEENMDVNHDFLLQPGKELVEQNMMTKTREILALMYRDYICTEEERKQILLQEKEKRIKESNKNNEEYNINFEKIKNNKKENFKETALVEISKEKWYKKLINKILKIFGIKNK